MRDAVIVPFNQQEELVITADNSGAIGTKQEDNLEASYETVSYYLFRVAMMENLAAGATPLSLVMQNFCDDDAWNELERGINQGLQEIEMERIPLTGSTESNFQLKQSAVGLTVIGKRTKCTQKAKPIEHLALIGKPLVGEEVLLQKEAVAPLLLCKQLATLSEESFIWPVGSKGILSELKRLLPGEEVEKLKEVTTSVNLLKSGGPATSFIVSYPKELEETIKSMAKNHFTKLK